jgi:glycosyltransferase involved in cell wall biosynthesis
MTKHILIDATTVSRHMDGLSQYILNVVSRLPKHEDRQYHVVVRPGECPETYAAQWVKAGMEVTEAPIDPIGPKREWQYRRWLRTQRTFDAAFVPSNQYPLALKMPAVYVVHDVIYERFPEQLGKLAPLKRAWLHHNVAKGLQQAAAVVAVSGFTKSEILRFHPTADANKIQVVYEGWEHLAVHGGQAPVSLPFRDYILYIGSSRGHKNLQGLLDAVSLAAERLPEGTGLVIAGDDRLLNAAQRKKIAAFKGKMVTTGWLTQEALNTCYMHAKAVIFPSLCEGFGIPVLEAFWFGKPLLVSNTSSLPEVAGDAALYFDPMKPEQMADVMVHALQMNEPELQRLVQRGKARLQAFSWQKTADEIDQILSQC